MHKKMTFQPTMLSKGSLTNITLIWTFPSMHTFMLLQITLLAKDFLTNIT
jgi:hypothetical protein